MTQGTMLRLADFPFVHWEAVRFRDLDAFVHVNNAVYATYFESARLAYYTELTGASLDKPDLILAEVTITFHASAVMGDKLAIGCKIASIGTKSFVMEHALFRGSDELLLTSGRSVLVAYDYVLGKSKPLSEAFRAAVKG